MQASKKFAVWDSLLPKALAAIKQQRFRQAAEILGPIAASDVRKALRWPHYRQALATCAFAHFHCGELTAALACQTRLLTHFNVDQEGRDNFFHLLLAASNRLPDSPEFQNLLLRLLAKTDVAAFAVPAARALLKDAAFARAFGFVLENGAEEIAEALQRGRLHPILQSRLLSLLMRETLIPLPEFDRFFRQLRKGLLMAHLASDRARPGKAELGLTGELAFHIWLGEYALFEDEEETGQVQLLEARLAGRAPDRSEPSETEQLDLACLALYQSWLATPGLKAWLELPVHAWKPFLRPLVAEWQACLEENAIADAIECLTPIKGDMTERVRTQYEESPFPRWRHNPIAQVTIPAGEWLRRQSLDIELPESFDEERIDVLVAGCGTGLEPISLVNQVKTAQVLAVDLSRASLAYAQRKAIQFGQEHAIRFMQADILAMEGLQERFHLVTASGVLHHLEDPLTGWRVLANLLRPGGIMLLSLYSELARASVVRARALIAENGWTATPQNMRRLRHDVLVGDLTELESLSLWRDFYNLSMLRDLVFHVNEHRFSLPRIETHLAELGLRFIGMRGLPAACVAQFRDEFPDDPDGRDLSNWHRFEERHPNTFASMYSLVVQRPAIDDAA